MAAPRKVFRIEEMAGARLSRRSDRAPAWHEREALPTDPQAEALQAKALQAEVQQALGALRATMAATTHAASGDGDAKQPGLDAAQLMRIAQELDAVVSGTAQATQKILAAAAGSVMGREYMQRQCNAGANFSIF